MQLFYAKKYDDALDALKTNPNMGDAYITIGLAYAVSSNDYEGDEFDKRTVFWAAVDKFVKAKQVDPSVAAKANEYIERYSPHFPTKDEAFFRDITAGKSVKAVDGLTRQRLLDLEIKYMTFLYRALKIKSITVLVLGR